MRKYKTIYFRYIISSKLAPLLSETLVNGKLHNTALI